MKSFSIATIVVAASFVSAGPIIKRQNAAPAITDVDILNYALTLEHLEDKFYRDGLANFTQEDFVNAGFADPFYDNLMEVSSDETTHVSFLTTALGSAAVAECTYNFPYTDPTSFVALASILEGVGVSAYVPRPKHLSNTLANIIQLSWSCSRHYEPRLPHSSWLDPDCRVSSLSISPCFAERISVPAAIRQPSRFR